jgi:hypothetical protein
MDTPPNCTHTLTNCTRTNSNCMRAEPNFIAPKPAKTRPILIKMAALAHFAGFFA